MCAEPDSTASRCGEPLASPAAGPGRRRSTGGDRTSHAPPDALRHTWLSHRLDRDVRAALQAILLWTDSALADLPDREPDDPGDCFRKVKTIRRELVEALSLVDELVAVGSPEGTDGGGLWPRSIVVRDLLAAAERKMSLEPGAGEVEIETRVAPENLSVVADPDRTLRAVVGLLRAGIRSARPGERLRLEAMAEAPEGRPDAGDRSVSIVLWAPRIALGPNDELEGLCRGMPSMAVDPRQAAAALPLAVAGRDAEILEGSLSVDRSGSPDKVKAILRLPGDRRPERRPGWIP